VWQSKCLTIDTNPPLLCARWAAARTIAPARARAAETLKLECTIRKAAKLQFDITAPVWQHRGLMSETEKSAMFPKERVQS
jgi:hypothetical protein